MAESEIFTLDQYKAICAAYAQGATRVKYGDKEIDYRTIKDMERIMAKMKAQLFPSEKPIAKTFIQVKRGFN